MRDKCIFKCSLYYYRGMVKPIVQVMTDIEKIVCFSLFRRRGGTSGHTELHREVSGLVRRQKEQEENME